MTNSVPASVIIYDVVALSIFASMSFVFLFPLNKYIPLDRRTMSVLGATLCFATRAFLFSGKDLDVLEAVDFDVLLLLSSIMIVNHLVIGQKETKIVIRKLRNYIQRNHLYGFWVISAVAFLMAPFLTNDGVCLLFVEPLLSIFTMEDSTELSPLTTSPRTPSSSSGKKEVLTSADAVYFLLTLACSSNIGSALTYTGNPQNMIVAGDSIRVLPPIMFLAYQLLPSILSWIISTSYIYYCWNASREEKSNVNYCDKMYNRMLRCVGISRNKVTDENLKLVNANVADSMHNESNDNNGRTSTDFNPVLPAPLLPKSSQTTPESDVESGGCVLINNSVDSDGIEMAPSKPTSPSRISISTEKLEAPREHFVVSPMPFMVIFLLLVMITMIFVDIMNIAALITMTAMVMICFIVFGNHWQNQLIQVPMSPECDDDSPAVVVPIDDMEADSPLVQEKRPLTREEKMNDLNLFFDSVFNSIDYTLLLIFLGTFIVVANVESTGIPKSLWKMIVGDVPFKSPSSVIGISLFVLIASQFLGNVAIIQMAKPNISPLGDDDKAFAWVLVSFVATIGGNLTLTGSAANIIVAEKARRINPDAPINFFNHFKVCFLVTLISCFLGGFIISITMNKV